VEQGTIADEAQRTILDESAWSQIVQEHQHTVLLSLLALGLSIDRARDLTNQTWARLLDQQDKGRLEEMSFPGLAVRQARFLALDSFKREKREAEAMETIGASTSLVAPGASPEDRVVHRERLERAIEAIAFCSPASQRVFRAVYEQPGVPHAVIAERFGLSVQRVRQILCEVRRKVRVALTEGEEER
jgi:RNA polymerase sigma-70 factor (ECF subfamily)